MSVGYDNEENRVRSLFSGSHNSGNGEVNRDAKDESGREVANGLYFYRLTQDKHTIVRRMLLLK